METQNALPRADPLRKALRWDPRLVQKMAERRVATMVGRMAFWTAGCWVLPMADPTLFPPLPPKQVGSLLASTTPRATATQNWKGSSRAGSWEQR